MDARDYAGPQDIPALQRLVAADVRARAGRPAALHVGDVPWRLLSVPRRPETHIGVWQDGDDIVAFAWMTGNELELTAAPGRKDGLLDVVLAWGEARTSEPLRVDCLDVDDEHRAALEARGFRPVDPDDVYYVHERTLAAVPEPTAAPGFTLRHLVLPEDLERRVEVHRSAFGTPGRPSRLTIGSYGEVTSAWPYRPELDWVVEAPDGTFAAFCLAWLDAENQLGLLEPVGTHAGHRRRGHATAACLGALAALREAGATRAIVLAESEPARALYRSLGFAEVGRFRWFAR